MENIPLWKDKTGLVEAEQFVKSPLNYWNKLETWVVWKNSKR